MSGLTVKQRAKVNAALCVIHDRGGDASAISALAQAIMRTGHDARAAYERALNQFAESDPEAGAAIGKFTRLIEASCPRTVAQYDTALSQYIDTGDGSALTALAPTIAADSLALALHNGEINAEQASSGDLAAAFGFELSAEFKAVANPNAGTPANRDAGTSTFAFDAAIPEPPASHSTSSVFAPCGNGPGMDAPKAAKAWSDNYYVGPVSVMSAPNGLSAKGAREAARSAVLNNGKALVDDTPA